MVSNKNSYKDTLRGVNLGGWLVLERWMTPSLFDGTDARDEYSFMNEPGARGKLERHRKNFITENDFKWIAGSGLNAVRIPVGYWLLHGDSPYAEGAMYLDWAVETAGKYGLKVLIDLHGAKGSQNGSDHSGRIGSVDWYHGWANQEETIHTLVELARRYRGEKALWGIELLNEPKVGPRTFLTLRSFYREAYLQLQKIAEPGVNIVFSDAFMPRLFSGALHGSEDHPVLMDVHWYQFGLADVQKYFAGLSHRPEEIERLQRKQPIIIGEWSGMLSHKTLEGKSEEEKVALQKRHIELQLAAYAPAEGWFYWTYKMEAPGIWNFRWLVESGVIRLD